jgi:hypothetical protein
MLITAFEEYYVQASIKAGFYIDKDREGSFQTTVHPDSTPTSSDNNKNAGASSPPLKSKGG